MSLKTFIIYFAALFLIGKNSMAQNIFPTGRDSLSNKTFSKFLVRSYHKDKFSFAKNWDYSWDIFKDDSTGQFSRNDGEPITPTDTAHLFYTANCLTNVQGGYQIRYCFADKTQEGFILTFSDGLSAFASQFYIYTKEDSFYFRPQTIYPVPGQNISYQVTKQILTLNKWKYSIGDIIMGYVDMEFIESVSLSEKQTQNHTYYLRGYIRTALR